MRPIQQGTQPRMWIVLLLVLIAISSRLSAQEMAWPEPTRAPNILIGAAYSLESFDTFYAPMHQGVLSVGLRNKNGTYTFKILEAKRFSINGAQAEVEAYPVLGDGLYAYASYAVGEAPVFPRHRVGAEVFSALPHSLEASVGTRMFFFQGGTSVILATGSASYYSGRYMFSVRPFVSVNTSQTSLSGSLTTRYYLSDNEEYLFARVGAGFSPDERWIQIAPGITGKQVTLLRSQTGGIGGQKVIAPKVMLIGTIDVTHQEVAFSPGSYVLDISVGLGTRIMF